MQTGLAKKAKVLVRGFVVKVFAGALSTLLPAGFVFADTAQSAAIGGNPVWTALKLLVSLGLLIALAIFSIRFLAKKTQLGASQGDLRIVAIRQLAPNRSVQVVEVADKQYLIGVGNEVTLLAELGPTFAPEREPEQVLSSFAQTLSDRIEVLRTKGETEQS